MSGTQTWYCSRGCNVFNSELYSTEEPPECANCGAVMSTNSDSYFGVHEAIEIQQVSEIEAKNNSI